MIQLLQNRERLHYLIDKIEEDDNNLVYDFLIRLIKSENKPTLSQYLNDTCTYVDENEQKEINELLSDLDETDEGIEIDVQEINSRGDIYK